MYMHTYKFICAYKYMLHSIFNHVHHFCLFSFALDVDCELDLTLKLQPHVLPLRLALLSTHCLLEIYIFIFLFLNLCLIFLIFLYFDTYMYICMCIFIFSNMWICKCLFVSPLARWQYRVCILYDVHLLLGFTSHSSFNRSPSDFICDLFYDFLFECLRLEWHGMH